MARAPATPAWPRSRGLRRALAASAISLSLAACGAASGGTQAIDDPRQGKAEIVRSACGSCHTIPGIPLADGKVGPPLEHFGKRMVIAGTLPNSLPNLTLWLRHPQQVAPGNAMPDTGLTDRQARDVAAYLYGLR